MCGIGAEVSSCIHQIGYTGFTALLKDANLEALDHPEMISGPLPTFAKHMGDDGWDLLWTTVNESLQAKEQKGWNSSRTLTRSEFIELLVRGAIDEQPPETAPANVHTLCAELVQVCTRGCGQGSMATHTHTSYAVCDASLGCTWWARVYPMHRRRR